MNRFATFLVALACAVGCSPAAPTPSPTPTPCAVGDAFDCTCANGIMGERRCVSTAAGPVFTTCGPCTITPPDDVPTAPDRTDPPPDVTGNPCASGTSCATCTPLPGCGWCGATGRCVTVNATCRGPATGTCGSGWACQSTDCPDSTECRPCTTSAECVSGQCLPRACDGVKACVPLGRPANCATIGGEACPVVAAYRRCTTTAECGPRMHCVPVWPGQSERVCTPVCNANADCPQPTTTGGVGTAVCLSAGTRACALVCMREGTCDTGSTCRRDINGTYAYCL